MNVIYIYQSCNFFEVYIIENVTRNIIIDSTGCEFIANMKAERPDTIQTKIQHTNITNLIMPTTPLCLSVNLK